MKPILSFIFPMILILSSISCSGNEISPKSLLQIILSSFSEMEVISGEFEQQKTISILSKPFISSGQFLSIKNHGLIWETKKPTPSKLIMTKGKMVQEISGRISEYKATGTAYDGLALLLPAVLNGDEALLKLYFTLDASQLNNRWKLQLKPISTKLFSVITNIIIRGQTESIEDILLSGADGDQTHIIFRSINMGREAPNAVDLERFKKSR